MSDNTGRFSDRVAAYTRYRPGYPPQLLSSLIELSELAPDATVADIGSGSGIFTRLLLQQGFRVYGVEPNSNMRLAAQQELSNCDNFTSIDANAEKTGLAEASIDLVTAAQAFHWFNNEPTKNEFRRILKADGWLALIWNQRKLSQPFQQAYDNLLRTRAPEYGKVNHMNLNDDHIAEYFARGQMQIHCFDNRQQLSFSALMGRLRSASYCPPEGSRLYRDLESAMKDVFDEHASDGEISFEYDTRLFLGRINR